MSRFSVKIFFILFVALFLFAPNFLFAATYNSSNSASYKQNIGINRGLVTWWTFDGADISGATVVDRGTNGTNGTLTANVSRAAGKIGQGIKIADTNVSYVNTTLPTTYSVGTISFWAKNIKQTTRGLVDSANMFVRSDGNTITLGKHSAGAMSSSPTGIYFGNFSNIVITFSSGTVNIYKNGIFNSSGTVADLALATDLRFGQDDTGACGGVLDDFRLYNRVLSTSEIKQLYALGGNKAAASTVGKGGSLTSGLVGHWTFDGADTTVTTVSDKSGQGNNGTRYGGVLIINGKLGQAMKFDGTTGYVLTSSPAGYSASTQNHTYSAWVYRTSACPSSYCWVINNGGNSDGSSLIIGSSLKIGYFFGGGAAVTYGNGDVTANTWHHIATVYNSTTNKVTFYLNGGYDGTSAALGAWSVGTGAVAFGRWGANNNHYLGGRIDDARIYSRVLSPSEIKQLYAMGGGTTANAPAPTTKSYVSGGLKSDLVGHWTFDGMDTTATTASDKSGQGNSGTRYGGIMVAAGKLGQALKFNGSTGYLDLGSPALLNLNNNFTVSVWIRVTNAAMIVNNSGGIVSWGEQSAGKRRSLILWNGGSGNNFYAINSGFGAAANIIGTSNVADDKWHHLAAVTNSSNFASIYVDGVLQNSGAVTYDSFVYSGTNIGRTQYPEYFPGSIDDIRIYSRALSASEIKQLYQMGK